jgi:predicted MFS family arabinose efflux permease
VLTGVVFLNTLCWALAYAVLPFYVYQLVPLPSDEGLQWRGWILGVTPLLTVVSMPIWIRVCRGRNPDGAILLVLILQGLCFGLTAAASSLWGVFVSRLLLGLSGPALTFAFMAAKVTSPHAVSPRVASMQTAITIGLVLGPFVGTATAALFGYRTTFAVGSVILVVSGLLSRYQSSPPHVRSEEQHATLPARGLRLLVPLIILVGYVQVFFLNAILPEVLTALHVAPNELLQAGGSVIFVSGLVLAFTSLAGPRLMSRIAARRSIQSFLILSSLLVVALPLAPSFWIFLVIRCLQVSVLGPLLVLAMANATQWSGQTLGLANSARVAAGAFGPLAATALVSRLPLHHVFAWVAAIGAATAVWAGFRWRLRPPEG